MSISDLCQHYLVSQCRCFEKLTNWLLVPSLSIIGPVAPKYRNLPLNLLEVQSTTPTIHRLAANKGPANDSVSEANQRRQRRDAQSAAAQAREEAKSADLNDFNPLRPLHDLPWAEEGMQVLQHTGHAFGNSLVYCIPGKVADRHIMSRS